MKSDAVGGERGSILAAGGIVWSGDTDPKIAIVHRPHRKDWVLPKGKLKLNEPAIAAAQREVQEETGWEVSVHNFLGSIAYDIEDKRKTVHFWRMEACKPIQGLHWDVDKVEWLFPDAAAKKLTHGLERDFVCSAAGLDRTGQSHNSRRLNRLEKFFDTSAARLFQALVVYDTELASTIATSTTGDANWIYVSQALLTRARRAIGDHDAETGWHCLKAAMRVELYGLDPKELNTRSARLLCEARDKLTSWRKDAVTNIQESAKESDLPAEKIAAIARLLHEHEDNRYKVLRIRWRQLAILGACAVLLLAAIAGSMSLTGEVDLFKGWSALQVAGMGALGAAISGILRVGDGNSARRIPDELGGFGFLLARLAVGGGAALFVVALWQAGFLKMGGVTNASAFIVAIAFVAGFSERLAQAAIDRLANSDKKSGSGTSVSSP